MNPIRNISNYPMSEDYELLFDLAHVHSVICEVDYSFHGDAKDDPPCRDIAHTLFRQDWYEISARGTAYISAFDKEEFIAGCKRYHVKFIMPFRVTPAPPCLRLIPEPARSSMPRAEISAGPARRRKDKE